MGNDTSKTALEQQYLQQSQYHQLTESITLEEQLQKRQKLETLLENYKHKMTVAQIEKIASILATLPKPPPQSQQPPPHPPPSNPTDQTTKEFNISITDALRVLNLQPNYTLPQLKEAFKLIALRYHPDKGGDPNKFIIIKQSYKLLEERIRPQSMQYQSHLDLRNNSRNHNESNPVIDKNNFNPKLFNKLYEENKLYDPNDTGYNDWLKSSTPDQPQQPQLADTMKQKFNASNFNDTFNKVKAHIKPSNQIIEYKDPQALVSCNTAFTDVDGSSPASFTKPIGEKRGGSVAYTDLKAAYTSDSVLINPDNVQYKTYKNVDELERDRSNVSFTMSPEEQERRKQLELQEIEAENRRMIRINERDMIIAHHYSKVHQQMLGYKPSSQ